MATIITPASSNDDSSAGLVVGVLLAVVLVGVLFFAFVMPRINDNGAAGQSGSSTDINVTVPSGSTGGASGSGSGSATN